MITSAFRSTATAALHRWRALLMLLVLLVPGISAVAQSNSTPPPAPRVPLQPEDRRSQLYVVALGDRLRISVYQEDDLSTISRVDAKGTVNLPLVGEVRVAGLTLIDAQAAISRAYVEGRYLRKPEVTLSVEEYTPREVTITGQVNSPGRYPLPPEATFTIIELVTKAGGFTDIAKGTSVVVTRIKDDGSKQNFTIDVESLLKGKEKGNVKDNSLLLEPGDYVYVPERII